MKDLFAGKAELYSKFRPSYTQNYIRFLEKHSGMDCNSIVADIGAGTGIHSKIVAPMVKELFCIDVSRDMLKECAKLQPTYPCMKTLVGSAENIPLPNASLDFITVAQAFHLFNINMCKTKFKRLLKSGGKIVLVWNTKPHSSSLFLENEQVLLKYCPKYARAVHATEFNDNMFSDLFEAARHVYIKFPFDNDEYLSEEVFINRTISVSYSLTPQERSYPYYLEALREVFYKHAVNNFVKQPLSTVVYYGVVTT